MKKLIIIRGLPGSGKTYLARNIEKVLGDVGLHTASVSYTAYFRDEDGREVIVGPEVSKAHKWSEERVDAFLADEDTDVVLVHNIFAEQWEVDPFLALADKHAADVRVISIFDAGLSDEELVRRSVHAVHPHVVDKHRRAWVKDINVE